MINKEIICEQTSITTKQTDLENFISLYKSFGIDCVVNELGENKIIYLINNYTYKNGHKLISVSHSWFLQQAYKRYISVFFDLQGKFISQRIL